MQRAKHCAEHYGSFRCARLSWKMEDSYGLSLAKQDGQWASSHF